MANAKLTQKPELTNLDDNDWSYVVDVSDTSESPQGTSKKFRKSTLWDYIRGKADLRYGTITVIQVQRYAGLGQNYNIPEESTAIIAYVDGYPHYPYNAEFPSDLNTFTKVDDIVTFATTIETDSQILIQYYL